MSEDQYSEEEYYLDEEQDREERRKRIVTLFGIAALVIVVLLKLPFNNTEGSQESKAATTSDGETISATELDMDTVSNLRSANDVSSDNLVAAIQACIDGETVGGLGIELSSRYSETIYAHNSRVKSEIDVWRADSTEGNYALVMSGNVFGRAQDFEEDHIGTWTCIAHYRSSDSLFPMYTQMEKQPLE